MSARPDEYLGDGVYLSDDGFQLWLAVGDHTNKVVALDLGVFVKLAASGDTRFKEMGAKREEG